MISMELINNWDYCLKFIICRHFKVSSTLVTLIQKVKILSTDNIRIAHSRFIEIQFYQTNYHTNKQNLPDLLWVEIVFHLQLPSEVNLAHFVSLSGSLFGELNFDKTRMSSTEKR